MSVKGVQESKLNLAWFEKNWPSQEFGGDLALFMPYILVGIKETKKKKIKIPEIKAYCNKKNLHCKILVIVDNAPGHPVYVNEFSENVKSVFLPPNTTAVIQPIN